MELDPLDMLPLSAHPPGSSSFAPEKSVPALPPFRKGTIPLSPSMTRSPILLIHGGAWDIPADLLDAHEQGVFDALQEGWRILESGGPAFDAGRGSFLTRDGRVQLDALMMDGATLRAGGVACVERIRNPIQAARLVLDKSHHVYFVGSGAEQFAASHGMPLVDNSELVLDRERDRLAEAQKRERSGLPDPTFSGSPSQ